MIGINRPPFDTVQLGRLGRIRLNRTWTAALKDVLDFYYASHPLPEWTFSLDDVTAAVGKPNPPLLVNANEDGTVNSGDQGLWAAMGVPQKLTQPPPPPPTTLNTIQTIIDDRTLPHEAIVIQSGSHAPVGYIWDRNPRISKVAPPSGFTAATGWGTTNVPEGGQGDLSNVRVHIRKQKTYLKVNGVYQLAVAFDGQSPGGSFYPDTSTNGGSISDLRPEASGGYSFRPSVGFCWHWWFPQRISVPAGTQGIWMTYEARLEQDHAGADNLDQVRIIANAGADWWRSLSAPFLPDFSNNAEAGIGRYKLLKRDWRAFNLSTVQDLANPTPPLQ